MNQAFHRNRIETILLVGNAYSGFLLEDAGFRSLDFEGESDAHSDAPCFKVAKTKQDAIALLTPENTKSEYDLIIIDENLVDGSGSELARSLRTIRSDIPIMVYTADVSMGNDSSRRPERMDDNIFIYYGAPSFWRALVRLQEDESNSSHVLGNDLGMAILLVEDEPNFYSHFLPMLYERLRESSIELLPPDKRPKSPWLTSINRPLVVLRRSFEEACDFLIKYESRVVAMITDLCFPLAGERNPDAGLRLLYRARAINGHLPIVVASRDREHEQAVLAANAQFLWKDSPRLLSDLKGFLREHCGFGPFVFRWPAGAIYGKAHNLEEFYRIVCDVPDVVYENHALQPDFVSWFAIHGYATLAKESRRIPLAIPDLRTQMVRRLEDVLSVRRSEASQEVSIVSSLSEL